MKNNILKKIISSKHGFTVMEMVVVLAIFSITATYSLAIFVQSNTVQKRTANVQKTMSDARYVLEVMAKEIRMGLIDYSYYGGTLPAMPIESDDDNILALIDSDDNSLHFRRYLVQADPERYVVQINYDDSGWLDITPEDLNITRLDFYILPDKDPFTWQSGYPNNSQPIVTIVLETMGTDFEGGTLTDSGGKTSSFQTTVTSRKYRR